eukprot:NODE_532_length_6386_cov_0.597264.p6 type:complete len:144 gc:universal NODE_532_length_6386_cov_0.597264:1046-1477(+)
MEAFYEMNEMMKLAHDDHMKMSMHSLINWDCCHFTLLFQWWTISNMWQFLFTLMALFLLTLSSEYVGLNKHPLANKLSTKPWMNEPLLVLMGWYRSLMGSLMMLVMMSFNGWIILTITLASALSKTVILKKVNLNEDEAVLCH